MIITISHKINQDFDIYQKIISLKVDCFLINSTLGRSLKVLKAFWGGGLSVSKIYQRHKSSYSILKRLFDAFQ